MFFIGSWFSRRKARAAPPISVSGPDTAPLPDAETLLTRGNAALDLGDLKTAEHCYRSAIVSAPKLADARINLSFVLQEMGRAREALAELQVAATLAPDSADAHYLLGAVRLDLGELARAIPELERAVALQPALVPAHRDLGKALFDTGRVHEAEQALRRGISAAPSSAELPFFLGNVYAESQRFELALDAYRAALALQPGMAAAHSNMVPALINACDFEGAAAAAQAALQLDPASLNARSNLLMALSRDPGCTAERYLSQAREYGAAVTALGQTGRLEDPNPPSRIHAGPDGRERRPMRIGLVSGDLRQHPVGYFLERALAHWDHARMTLVAFANQRGGDAVTARLRAHTDAWHDIAALDDTAAAKLIADEGIDVLVDLSGHTPHNRLPLFARRAAPLQASWLGYWASTGVPAIDYLLADPVSVPDVCRADFTEQIWHLPQTRLCFSPPEEAPAVSPLPALQAGHVTFGSFQSMVKLNGPVLGLWARVLLALPGARLRLQALQFGDAAACADMRRRLDRAGIDPYRADLVPPMSRAAYLAAHAQVDMVLDTFPHAGGTTTCEALWMGVPTLTLPGRSLLARQGAALLGAAGLPDWVASDADDFVARAHAFATQVPSLAELRAGLRQRVVVSPLFDARRFAVDLQDALGRMSSNGLRQCSAAL